VFLYGPPLVLVQASRLVDDLDGHPRLAYIVQQGRQTKVVELLLGQSDLLPECDRENADVDRVGESVFVIVPERRQANEGGFIVEDLVDDILNCALYFLQAGRPTQSHTVDDILGDGHSL
jgi:hypothetical protein